MKRILLALACLLFPVRVDAWTPGTPSLSATGGFAVDRTSRRDVLAFYHTIYNASQNYAANRQWTGDVTTGVPGTTSAAFKADVLRRINFYRALCGLPADIAFNDDLSAKCQEAALMFSANKDIAHSPPPSWIYYTANAAEAAGKSNIAYGSHGPDAVDAYMEDYGLNNTAVGHRRWLLYPMAQTMGTGDVPASADKPDANAIWVIGHFKSSAPKKFTAWPNAGYVPNDLVPQRWSLSFPGANFNSATVAMSLNGTSVPLQVVSPSTLNIGDNTIVWEPFGLDLDSPADLTCNVTVSGISGAGVPTSQSYSVTLFHSSVLGESVVIKGPPGASLAGQVYTFAAIAQADAYELRVSSPSGALWSEGAESDAGVIDGTSVSYALRQSDVKRSGASAFHLTIPSFAEDFQSFEIARDIVPTETSQVVFYNLFRYVTTATRLSLQVSDDAGSTWTELWSRNGNGSTSSRGWDPTFNPSSVNLAAYAGRPVRLRFVFETKNSSFIGTETTDGVFLDDISVSNANELAETATTTLSSNATSFALNATTAGAPLVPGKTYILRLRPNIGTHWFGNGELKSVTAEDIEPTPAPDFDPEPIENIKSSPGSSSLSPTSSNDSSSKIKKSQAAKKQNKPSAANAKKSKGIKKSGGKKKK
ncbi:MAG: CAP domain-containing protein [Verrucomicrobia bacterium]|nr:CAP domain-containing protein [Verrucomicrobiota bacterium]